MYHKEAKKRKTKRKCDHRAVPSACPSLVHMRSNFNRQNLSRCDVSGSGDRWALAVRLHRVQNLAEIRLATANPHPKRVRGILNVRHGAQLRGLVDQVGHFWKPRPAIRRNQNNNIERPWLGNFKGKNRFIEILFFWIQKRNFWGRKKKFLRKKKISFFFQKKIFSVPKKSPSKNTWEPIHPRYTGPSVRHVQRMAVPVSRRPQTREPARQIRTCPAHSSVNHRGTPKRPSHFRRRDSAENFFQHKDSAQRLGPETRPKKIDKIFPSVRGKGLKLVTRWKAFKKRNKKPIETFFFCPNHIDFDFDRYSFELSWSSHFIFQKNMVLFEIFVSVFKSEKVEVFNLRKIDIKKGAPRAHFFLFPLFFKFQNIYLFHIWIHSITTSNQRVPTENQRVPTENQRVSTENQRVSTENQRVPTENRRVPTENQRVPTEN